MGDVLNPLDNPYDDDAGHHGDQVIKLSSESQSDTKSDKSIELTPIPTKQKFFLSRKKNQSTASTASTMTNEILEMRRKEHTAKMAKLEWETAYWRRRYECDFGFTPQDNKKINRNNYHDI